MGAGVGFEPAEENPLPVVSQKYTLFKIIAGTEIRTELEKGDFESIKKLLESWSEASATTRAAVLHLLTAMV